MLDMLRVPDLRNEPILLAIPLIVSIRPIYVGITRITMNTSPPTDYDVRTTLAKLEEMLSHDRS